VVRVAAPVESRFNTARTLVPSLKLTTPVGMPEVELTKAVNEIDCPAVIWVVEAVSVVVVGLGID
jgi:hypothetical protein